MNINLGELEEYVQNVESVPSVIDVPKFPIPKESHLNFLKPGSNEILSRPVHIHEHLPPIRLLPIDAENIEFPENEAEVDLVDVVSVNNTTQSVTSEITMENNINDMEQQSQLQTNSYSSKKTNETSNNLGPNFNENVKRFLVENDLRPTREITSVMMTTSGFISPAREGKLPDSKVPVIVDDYKSPINQSTTIQSQFPSLSSSFVSSTLTTTTSAPSDLKTPMNSSVGNANALHSESQFYNNSSSVEGSKPEKIKKKKFHDKERKKLKNQKTLQKSHSMGHQHPFGSNIDGVPGNEKHNNFLFNANTPMIGSKKNRNVSNVDSTGGPLEMKKVKNKQMDIHFSKKKNKNLFFPSNNNDKSSNLIHKLGRKNKHKQSLMKPKHLPHMFENDVSGIKNNEINRTFSKNNIQAQSQGLQHSSSQHLASNFESFGNQYDDYSPTGVPSLNIGSSLINSHSIGQSFSQSFPSEKLSTEPDRQKLNIFKKLSSTTVASNANVGSANNNKDSVKINDDVIILTSDDQTPVNSEEFSNVKKRNKTQRNSKHSQNEGGESKFSNIPNNSFGSFNSEFNYDDQLSPRKNMDTQINLPRTPDIVLNNSNNTNLSGSEEMMPAPLLPSSRSTIVTPTTKEKKKRSKKEKKKQRLMDVMDTEPPPPFVAETAPSFPFYEKPSISPFLLANNSAAAALGLQPPPRVGFGDIMNFSAFQRFPNHQNFGSSFHKQQDDNAYTMSTYTPQGLDSPLFAPSSAQISNAYESSERIKSNRTHDSDMDLKSLYDKSHCNVAPLIPPSLILHDSLSNQINSSFLDKPIHLGESAPPKTSTKQETKTKSKKSNKNHNTISNLIPDGGVDDVGCFTGPHKTISKESISPVLPGSFTEDNDNKPSKRSTQLPTFSFWDNNETRKTESVDNGALTTEVIDVDVDSGDDSKIVAIPVGKNKGDKKKLKKKDKELIKSKKKKDKKEKIKNKNRVEDIKKDKKEKRLKDPKDKMSKKEKKERKKEKEVCFTYTYN